MQNQNLPLLSITRENYQVPKGEEQEVHYKAERILYDPNDGRTRLSHPDLIKTNVKMFDDVKRNLELQGYTIEILYHPQGKYTNVRIPKDAGTELRERTEELAKAQDEIARLRAELDAQMKATTASEKQEGKPENAPQNDGENAEPAPAKKSGRPKKGE